MSKQIRLLNGYRAFYNPNSTTEATNRNANGYVYEHVRVIEKSLKRPLNNNEEVHHLDGDRGNNLLSNLIVLDKAMHGRLHSWLRKGAAYIPKDATLDSGRLCVCGEPLLKTVQKFCSVGCYLSSIKNNTKPTKETLEKDLESMTYTAVGKKYGVSDNAIRKWLRSADLKLES